jgi:hypothetical protein
MTNIDVYATTPSFRREEFLAQLNPPMEDFFNTGFTALDETIFAFAREIPKQLACQVPQKASSTPFVDVVTTTAL